MKNIIIIILILSGVFYFFVPYNTQINILDKAWIDSSFLWAPEKVATNLEWWIVGLKFDSENKVIYKWNISTWETMSDLSWASWNFVKCFDEDKYDKFSGNILMHRVLLGKNKNVSVRLIWEGSEDLSIFVYKTDALSKVYPPEKDYTHDCKTSVLFDSNREMKIEMKWNTITSDIVVWVAWSKWVLEWGYTLEIIEK